MKINENFIVTEMTLDGFKLTVPEGFSELMNRSSAWKYIKTDNSLSEGDGLKNYDRKVVLEDGKLRTYLTYKKSSCNGEVNRSVGVKSKEVNNLTFF